MEDPKANPPSEKKPFDYVGLVQGKRSEGTVMAKTEDEAAEHLKRLGVQSFAFKGKAPKPPVAIPQAPPSPAVQPPMPPLPAALQGKAAVVPTPAQQAQVVAHPAQGVPPRPQARPMPVPQGSQSKAAQQAQALLAAKRAMLHNHSCTCGCQDNLVAKAGTMGVPRLQNAGVRAELAAAQDATRKQGGRRQTVIVGDEKVAMEKAEDLLSKADGKVMHIQMNPDCHGKMCFVFVIEHNQ